MTTSGTTTYKLKVDELIEEAYENAQSMGVIINSQNARSALRSLNLVLKSLVNEGYPLSKHELVEIPMVEGQAEYILEDSIFNLVNVVSVTDFSGETRDLNMQAISPNTYLQISHKNIKSRPSQYAVDIGRDNVKLFVYPVPNAQTSKLKAYVLKHIEDVKTLTEEIDISSDYYDAVVWGLAHRLARKTQGIDEIKVADLFAKYQYYLDNAATNDRDRSDLTLHIGGR